MATPRVQRLKSMARNFPVMDEQAEAREQAALVTQFQTGIAAAPTGPSATRQAQQITPQAVAAAGQVTQRHAQQQTQTQMQLGTQAIQEQQRTGQLQLQQQEREQNQALAMEGMQAELATQTADIQSRKQITEREISQKLRLQQQGIDQDNRLLSLSLKQREDLHTLGSDLNGKLFEAQMRFQRDELGRKFSNERQLADYAVASAQSDIQLQDRMREMEQAGRKDIIMLEAAHAKMEQALKQGYLKEKQKLDQKSREALVRMKHDLEKKIAKKKAKSAAIGAVLTGGGMVAGAVIGGPGGAALGAGAGQAAAGLFESGGGV